MRRNRLRSRMRTLYFGHTQSAVRFQGLLLLLDILIIGFFIVSQFIAELPWFWIVDACIAVFLTIDLLARLFALGTVRRWLKYPDDLDRSRRAGDIVLAERALQLGLPAHIAAVDARA